MKKKDSSYANKLTIVFFLVTLALALAGALIGWEVFGTKAALGTGSIIGGMIGLGLFVYFLFFKER